ncbi:MAG: GDSL-type esterase/lipase family protein [Pirellulaceae bacterium]|nr:GDSL-type esterase/lipase family protein [Pirellulaceae bacterium]
MKTIRLFCIPLLLIAFTTFTAAEEPHSAIKPVPRAGGWLTRHESFNKRVAQGKVDLVFIGDSITQGWEGSGKDVWAKYYANRNTVNLGIGGDRTQHVIWRLDNGNLKNITPKAAVIMIGTNNSGSNTSAEIADGVKVIVEQIRKMSPKTKILVLGVFPRGTNNDDARRKVNQGANAIFKNLADSKHVHYLDIGKHFLTDDGTLTREIMPDLLHLSPKGYLIWAESIEKPLVDLLHE